MGLLVIWNRDLEFIIRMGVECVCAVMVNAGVLERASVVFAYLMVFVDGLWVIVIEGSK